MGKIIRIGTRESQLAVWQATQVQVLLAQNGYPAELVYIKSEGDIDLHTPLYEMGVQGIFTRSLDMALLNGRIDLAVHSMKDVPTQLPAGIRPAAVLKRGPVKDLLVYKGEWAEEKGEWTLPGKLVLHIASSSIRRKAQWLNRYPAHQLHNLRGNVNTRLKKLQEENWDGAIFAQAGLERIGLRPENAKELDWMLPAPAQGAILVASLEKDSYTTEACRTFNDLETEICTRTERSFLRTLLGGCSTPISAFAQVNGNEIHFRGNILTLDGAEKAVVELKAGLTESEELGTRAAALLLENGGLAIAAKIRNAAS
ncbi:MAG: hydroxymethylbilane synthase [Sphingobacteriales bacterium]|nr:hydroxymethylbilane synthase [Sphingobacteriales bacterium]